MPEIQEREIEIRSEEVHEIMSQVPNWMIRFGISLIFGLILLVLLIAWIIKYPDVIKGATILTTEIPPAKLNSLSTGKIVKLFKQNKEQVNTGDFIAEIENPVTEEAINYLMGINQSIMESKKEGYSGRISFRDEDFVFGEMQADYNSLKKGYSEIKSLAGSEYYLKKGSSLQFQLSNYKRLLELSEKQLKYGEMELKNSELLFESNKKLFEINALSKFEYLKEEASYTNSRSNYENLLKACVQNKITIGELEMQLNELSFERDERLRKLDELVAHSLDNISNYIANWKKNYLIISPFKGELNYLFAVEENLFVKAGMELFAVIPENNEYVCQVSVPMHGFAKIKTGQMAIIKLDNYPYHEYGQLKAKVADVSKLSNDQSYLVKINLTNGLTSTFKKQFEFKPEMQGSAEIITEDLRLLQRIFYQFKKLAEMK